MSRYKPLVEQLEPEISSGRLRRLADLAKLPIGWRAEITTAGPFVIEIDEAGDGAVVLRFLPTTSLRRSAIEFELQPQEMVELGLALTRAGLHGGGKLPGAT